MLRSNDAASGCVAGRSAVSVRALVLAGAVIGSLAGALAGLTEAALSALVIRSLRTFSEVFGYAILLDATGFALLGVALTLLAAWIVRVSRLSHDRSWGIPLGGSLVCLVISGIFLGSAPTVPGSWSTQVAEGRLPVGVAWTGLAVLLGVLLAPGRRTTWYARTFVFRIAPAVLALMVGGALVGVALDLRAHGLTLTGSQSHAVVSQPPAALHDDILPPGSPRPLPTVYPTGADPSRSSVTATSQPAPLHGAAPLATQAAATQTAVTQTAWPARRPNVLLITVDSLRADHLGAYGYSRARTPTLDRLAAEGVLIRQAYTSRNGTTPAHAGIFTGAYPARHGIRSHMFDLLDPGVSTIAEAFAADGYATAGLFSWLAFEPAYSGLDRGFQVYTDLTVNLPRYLTDTRTSALAATYKRLKSVLLLPGAIDRQMAFSADIEETLDGKADVTTDAAMLWLDEYRQATEERGQPFFLWIHYWDPHYPYTPPPPFDAIVPDECDECPDGSIPTIRSIQQGNPLTEAQTSHLIQYYDGEIAFVDQQLGRLFEGLAGMGLDQDTVIVVIGDHGESFGEMDRWLHGWDLLEAEIHVPLIIRFPDQQFAERRVDVSVSHVDVMPTLLEYAGVAIPATTEGRSLLPVIQGTDPGDDRYAVAELADRSVVTLVTRDWQVLIGPEQTVRLFRVTPEGHGRDDLFSAYPEVVNDLLRRLAEWQAAHP
ncbi:MAG: sulfatase-like hydrolase/transferase [Chloroflexota bacterium]